MSKFFLPVLKETPSEAGIMSHKLMLRSGMVKQQSAGIYSWLPLGLIALKNIERLVRKSMNKHGMIEVLMPCVQHSDLWIESGRYDAYGAEMLRIQDRHEQKMLFGPTNEEVITDIFRTSVKSYKDLPKTFYQIQWKFRDEIRPRFGLLRGREFFMKDGYSFDIDKKSSEQSYENAYRAYFDAFKSMGLKVIPVLADNGPIGGDLSHEFQVPAENGESTIYYDQDFENDIDVETARKLYAASEEKHDVSLKHGSNIKMKKGIEVGHIFYFGTKYSVPMKALVNDKAGNLIPVEMGSYGIGVSRLVAAIIEANHDEYGIIFPEEIAPFKVSLINLNPNDEETVKFCDSLYVELEKAGISVLCDDTDERAGAKFATHDLIGSPYQVIVNKNKAIEGIVELKHRRTKKIELINKELLIDKFK